MDEKDLMRAIVEYAARRAAENMASDCSFVLSNDVTDCESPIERVLLLALYAEFSIQGMIVIIPPGDLLARSLTEGGDGFKKPDPEDWHGAEIACQVPIGDGRFRVDLIVQVGDLWIAVECDGHAFHERTKEQAGRDKSRDRALQTAGLRVFRFTGSEIWRDPIKCARDIVIAVREHTRRDAQRYLDELNSRPS
jgi:very-short-patch-repair endonuclease